MPDITNPYFPSIVKGLEDTAKQYGYGVIIGNTNDEPDVEKTLIRNMASHLVAGICFVKALKGNNLDSCKQIDLPIVVVDREIEAGDYGFGQVYVDTIKGIYDSTCELIKAGCRKIAFISAYYKNEDNDRYIGYKQALLDNQLMLNESLVYREKYDYPTGYEGIRIILDENSVDGVVCGNDLIAAGVLSFLKENNIRVPDQIKVMGFDDIYLAQCLSPALSTVNQPAYRIGSEAAKMLIDNIEYGTPLFTKKIDYELVMRGTV